VQEALEWIEGDRSMCDNDETKKIISAERDEEEEEEEEEGLEKVETEEDEEQEEFEEFSPSEADPEISEEEPKHADSEGETERKKRNGKTSKKRRQQETDVSEDEIPNKRKNFKRLRVNSRMKLNFEEGILSSSSETKRKRGRKPRQSNGNEEHVKTFDKEFVAPGKKIKRHLLDKFTTQEKETHEKNKNNLSKNHNNSHNKKSHKNNNKNGDNSSDNNSETEMKEEKEKQGSPQQEDEDATSLVQTQDQGESKKEQKSEDYDEVSPTQKVTDPPRDDEFAVSPTQKVNSPRERLAEADDVSPTQILHREQEFVVTPSQTSKQLEKTNQQSEEQITVTPTQQVRRTKTKHENYDEDFTPTQVVRHNRQKSNKDKKSILSGNVGSPSQNGKQIAKEKDCYDDTVSPTQRTTPKQPFKPTETGKKLEYDDMVSPTQKVSPNNRSSNNKEKKREYFEDTVSPTQIVVTTSGTPISPTQKVFNETFGSSGYGAAMIDSYQTPSPLKMRKNLSSNRAQSSFSPDVLDDVLDLHLEKSPLPPESKDTVKKIVEELLAVEKANWECKSHAALKQQIEDTQKKYDENFDKCLKMIKTLNAENSNLENRMMRTIESVNIQQKEMMEQQDSKWKKLMAKMETGFEDNKQEMLHGLCDWIRTMENNMKQVRMGIEKMCNDNNND